MFSPSDHTRPPRSVEIGMGMMVIVIAFCAAAWWDGFTPLAYAPRTARSFVRAPWHMQVFFVATMIVVAYIGMRGTRLVYQGWQMIRAGWRQRPRR